MKSPHSDGSGYVPVYRAPDEVTAHLVLDLLKGEGIPALLKSLQIPWYDGIMKMGEGYWGDVLVPEESVERAREIISVYESNDDNVEGEDT